MYKPNRVHDYFETPIQTIWPKTMSHYSLSKIPICSAPLIRKTHRNWKKKKNCAVVTRKRALSIEVRDMRLCLGFSFLGAVCYYLFEMWHCLSQIAGFVSEAQHGRPRGTPCICHYFTPLPTNTQTHLHTLTTCFVYAIPTDRWWWQTHEYIRRFCEEHFSVYLFWKIFGAGDRWRKI